LRSSFQQSVYVCVRLRQKNKSGSVNFAKENYNMKKKITIAVIAICIAGMSAALWFSLRPPGNIPVGIVCWTGSGAVVGSSEISAADLFLEEHKSSLIQPVPVDDQWNPDKTAAVVREAMNKGINFFISTHPSKCAVACIHLFTEPSALLINTASTSPALSGKDDYFLRIVADGELEQRAIARFVITLPGKRLLLLQDSGNLPYTDPAFKYFSEELKSKDKWEIVHRKLAVSDFNPQEFHALMSENFDAIYILAGSFQAAIGNIAQLFHYYHPESPIILTPWARSPAILEIAGSAISRIILPTQYPSRSDDPAFDLYFRRFNDRFGYEPHSMAIGVRQALELLEQAFSKGYKTPEAVKKYLLSIPVHQTSLGPIAFDRYGDVSQKFYFIHDVEKELR